MTDESIVPPAARWRRALAAYGVAAAASVLAAVSFLRLWRADLRVPFDYHGDALYSCMIVKSVVEEGWYLTISRLGAPGVLAMHDFPSAEALHLLVIKAMSGFTSDWALIFNLYFLFGFPLITISALAVFRHFRVAYMPALTGSLLYTFLPRHVLVGESHYFLDIYYQVPLAVLVALWVCGPDPPIVGDRVAGRWPRLDLRRGRSVAAIAICVLTSATGIYYAFFAGVLVLLGGAWASLTRRTSRNALAGVMLAGVMVAGLVAQELPNRVYVRRHGVNPAVAVRSPGESEVYGMRMAQLLLPVPDHRVAALRQLRKRYDTLAPFPGESSTSALGIVGSIGFLMLLGLVLLPSRRAGSRGDLSGALAVLNLVALLVATTGGFGALFALLVTPRIRTYARMHVFTEFLALFAVTLLIEGICRRERRPAWRLSLLPAVVLILGLLDQVPPSALRDYAAVTEEFAHDRAFVRRIEAALPRSAMVFELPYQPFPEPSDLESPRNLGYDPLHPYLHSATLRWSYPAMRGRAADYFARNASARPPADLVQTLSGAGFGGILIDRRGYDDGGRGLAEALGREIGAEPAISADDRLIFFDLTAYGRRAFGNMAPEERARHRDLAAHPLFLRWGEGFYETEHGQDVSFRWCSGSGVIDIDNDSSLTRQARITMTLEALHPPSLLFIRGDLVSERVEIVARGTFFSRTVQIPPGRHRLIFDSSSPPALAPGDPRLLAWRAIGTTLEEVVPP